MIRARVLTPSLCMFLAAVAAILLVAAWQRVWPPTAAAAQQLLADGDVEHRERIRLLEIVRGAGRPGGERAITLAAAMAAVALDDEAACRSLLGVAATDRPLGAADVALADSAGLGDPVLSALLAAMAAEAGGDAGAARAAYQRAGASSRLFHMPLAGRLCSEGLARLGPR